jgi:hypothetical protein
VKRTSHAALLSALLLATLAARAQDASETPAASSAPPLLQRVEGAITRGAHAAASGVERGAKATARAVERGAPAAALHAAGRSLHAVGSAARGAEATGNAVRRVANKVEGPAAASATSN